MAKVDFDREIYEGWTVRDFINELEPQLDLIQSNKSFMRPIKTKEELKDWCKDNQPYYKKYVPDVVNYFAQKYNIK